MQGAVPPPSSSLGKSIAGGMPAFAPPVEPQSSFIGGGPTFGAAVRVASVRPRDGATVVNRRNRLNGMRFLYQKGSYTTPWFRMKATGQVESSKFQPTETTTWFAAFNDALYCVGYPRNLGLSEKVATIPPEALGTTPSQMAPRPRYTKSIFTNRSYAGAASIPAKPTQGAHS